MEKNSLYNQWKFFWFLIRIASDCIVFSIFGVVFLFFFPLFIGKINIGFINIDLIFILMVIFSVFYILFDLFPKFFRGIKNLLFWNTELKRVTSISEKKFNIYYPNKKKIINEFLLVGLVVSLLLSLWIGIFFMFSFSVSRGSEGWLISTILLYVFIIFISFLYNLN